MTSKDIVSKDSKILIVTNKDKFIQIPNGWKINEILGYSQGLSSTQGFIKYIILSIIKQ